MNRKVILAGVLGGVAMFVWSSFAHMALPLGEAGISQITSNEEALLSSMRATLGENSGLYMFPAMGADRDMNAYERKLAGNPSGLLIYRPPGEKAMTPGQLVIEFLKETVAALIAAMLLANSSVRGFGGRVGFVAAIGLVAAIGTNISYWNWFHFPGTYTASAITIEFVGFLAAGAAIAAVLKSETLKSAPATA